MVDDHVADIDPIHEARAVLGKIGKSLGVTRPQRLAAGLRDRAVQTCNDAIGRIAGEHRVQILRVVRLQLALNEINRRAHRSISPKTMSIEPSTAETSASM